MNIKEGRGNGRNSEHWAVCYNESDGRYTAHLSFGSDMMTMTAFYEITKEIFDTVGTFEDDDYKSQELIRTGRLLYYTEDSKWGGSFEKIEDPNYKEICAWFFDWKKGKRLINLEKLPDTYSSGHITEEQIRTKYGKDISAACMQLELGDSDFLQNYDAYRKKYRNWIPYYYRSIIKKVIKRPDTKCVQVVLLDDNRFQNMKHLLCARRIGNDKFEKMVVTLKYSTASDIKGSFAYIAFNESGNIAFEDLDTSINKDAILEIKRYKSKLNKIKTAWIAYALVSCVAAIVLLIATLEMLYAKAISLLICFFYIAIMYAISLLIRKHHSIEEYKYIRKDGIHLLTAFMVLLIGAVCLLGK